MQNDTKRNLIILFLFSIISTFFFSCDKNIITEPKEKEITNQLPKKPDIDPKGLVCNRRTKFVWVFDHYESIVGKELGFNHSNFATMETMKNKWGFTNVIVNSSNILNSVNSGFQTNNISVSIDVNETSGIFTYSTYGYEINNFFVDEYCERFDFSLSNIVNLANQLYPSNLYLNSWKTSTYFFEENVIDQYKFILNSTLNTQMVCDQYHDETLFCGNDQTYHWYTFKNKYGSNRVKSHWVHLLIDGDENDFNLLFLKAYILGINKLWLYIGAKEDDICDNGEKLTKAKFNSYLSSFLSYAKKYGWLKQYDRLIRYEYFCPGSTPCITCNQDIISEGTGWILENIIDTGYIEEYNSSHIEEDIH